MRVVRRHTAFVSGIPRDGAFGGDPSPKTAWGVFVAIEAGVQQQFKRASLEGVSVAREYRGEGDEAAVMAEVSRIRERVIELLEARAARGPAAGARRRRLGARQAAVAEVRS